MMKKISQLCMLVLVVVSSFFVFNITYTNEIIRIRELDRTVHSIDFYLKDVNKSPREVLDFFTELSEQYNVSIVKTDVTEEVVKAGVFDAKTFPYQQFGLEKIDFQSEPTGVYSNVDVEHKIGQIQTFLQAQPIYLLTLREYLKDGSHSVNGMYRFSSTYELNHEVLLAEVSDFFAISITELTTPPYSSRIEYLNRDLLMGIVIFVIGFVLLLLTSIYQPLMAMKSIGVEKLLGYTNRTVWWRFIKPNLYVLVGGMIVGLVAPHFFLDYVPESYTLLLLFVHVILIQVYLLASLIIYIVILNINVVTMLKGFSSFKIGFYVNYVIKAVMTTILAGLLVAVGSSLWEEHKEWQYQQQWSTQGDFLTLESVRESNELSQAFLSGSKEFDEYYERFYLSLVEAMPTYYINSSRVAVDVLVPLELRTKYNLTHDLEVMFLNRAYLKVKGLDIAPASGKKIILLPEMLKENEERALFLAKFTAFLSLSYEEQQTQQIEEMEVEMRYYSGEHSFFPFDPLETENFINPIISVVEDNHLFADERSFLSSSRLGSPIKIENTLENQQKIEQLVAQLPDRTYLKFSSIRSIQQLSIDTYQQAAQNFYVLFVVFACISLFVSYFIVRSLFVWRKAHISTMKFMGWTLFDRYRFLVSFLALNYLVPVPLLMYFGRSLIPILVFLVFTCFDIGIILAIAVKIEQKNLVQFLKGETL